MFYGGVALFTFFLPNFPGASGQLAIPSSSRRIFLQLGKEQLTNNSSNNLTLLCRIYYRALVYAVLIFCSITYQEMHFYKSPCYYSTKIQALGLQTLSTPQKGSGCRRLMRGTYTVLVFWRSRWHPAYAMSNTTLIIWRNPL